MSTVATESPSALGSASVRGRGTGRGRTTRARGRARGSFSFQFPASSRPDTTTGSDEAVKAPSANGHLSSSEGKRKPFTRAPNAPKAPTTAAPPEAVTPTAAQSAAKPAIEKELPPHITGPAVDAISLGSRVQELAINAHAHTSSVESRFSTHLNWADEEDDPDSLPDLDDWAIPSKFVDVPVSRKVVEEIPAEEAAVAGPAVQPAKQEETTIQEDTCVPTNGEATAAESQAEVEPPQVATEAAEVQKPATPKPRPRQGLEASIWASSPSSTFSPPPNRTAKPRGKHTRAASHRPPSSTKPALQPTHFSRNSVANSTPSPTPSQQEDTKPTTRKPHSRPIISGTALAALHRDLGKNPQSTPT
jgi:hypothetical protein